MASIRDLGSGDLAQALHRRAARGILVLRGSVGESVLKPKPTRLTRLKLTPKRNISHLDACIFGLKFGDFLCLKIAKFSLKSAERAPRVPGRPLQSLEDDRGGNTVIFEALHWTSRTEM